MRPHTHTEYRESVKPLERDSLVKKLKAVILTVLRVNKKHDDFSRQAPVSIPVWAATRGLVSGGVPGDTRWVYRRDVTRCLSGCFKPQGVTQVGITSSRAREAYTQ